jgi:ATP-dependent protease ClpP protease subunit
MFEVNEATAQIKAYGLVGVEGAAGFTHIEFMQALESLSGQDVTIRMQSPGGDIASGLSMFNSLKDFDGSSTVVIDAMAASISSVFPLGADEVLAFPKSRVVVHNPWTMAVGDAKGFRNTAAALDLLALDIADVYSEGTGKSQAFWLDKMEAETYFSAEQALDVGLITGIYGGAVKAAAKVRSARPKMAYLHALQARLALSIK